MRHNSTTPHLLLLLREGRYDEVLQSIARVEARRGLSPVELVLKGRCLQLSSNSAASNLKEAEAAFRAALGIDENYIPALLELAWFIMRLRTIQGKYFLLRQSA